MNTPLWSDTAVKDRYLVLPDGGQITFDPTGKWQVPDGTIFINDQPYPMEDVSQVVAPLYAASERALVISIRGDREVPYLYMDLLQKELVAAGVVRVVFAAQLEQSMQRERR